MQPFCSTAQNATLSHNKNVQMNDAQQSHNVDVACYVTIF
jgi:hypothetical protein